MLSLRRIMLILTFTMLLLLSAACGDTPPNPPPSGSPTIPAFTPVAWGPLPTPPAEVMVDTPEISITLQPEQGIAIFPVRVVGRRDSPPPAPNRPPPSARITFSIEVWNNTKHDITKTSGIIYYKDTSGKLIEADQFSFENPIKAGETVIVNNSFLDMAQIETRKTLKEIPLEDLRVEYRPNFITYAQGIGQEITYPR